MSRRFAPSVAMSGWLRATALPLLIFSLAALLYSNTLGNGFVFDDRHIIERNPSLRSAQGVSGLLMSPYWSGEGRTNRLYRPITIATFAMNRALSGGDPWGFHLLNALLHGMAAVMLFVLLSRLFGPSRMALAAAALFAVHPALTESVAGLVGRAEILSTVFLLAALRLDRAELPRRLLAVAGSITCYSMALLSKENALAYPGLVALTDFLLGSPAGVSRRRRAVEFLAILGATSAYLVLRFKVLGSLMEISAIPKVDNLLVAVSPARRFLTALSLVGKYLGLFLLPARLSADYSARQIEPVEGILDPASWLGIVIVVALGVLFFRFRRRLVPISWGLGFAAVSFFLVSNIPFPIGTIFAERLLYLPLAGLCASAGLVASVGAEKRPRSVGAAALVILTLFAARTWTRNRDWKDDFSLFRSAAKVSPKSARVRYNLGNAYRRRGDLSRAEENYRECLRIDSKFDPARRNLGVILSAMGRGEESIAMLREALEANPGSASLHNNLGNAYQGLGRIAEAEAEYSHALELDPSSADAHNNLGAVFHERGETERAEVEYRESIRLSPERAAFRINLGNLLLQRGDPAGAKRTFRGAVEQDPSLPQAHRGLGEALLGVGDLGGAEMELQRSVALDPNQWEAPALLGYLHQQRGEGEKAIRFYLESLSRKPDQPELEQNLGALYSTMSGGKEQALDHLRRCLAMRPPRPVEQRAKSLIEQLESGKVAGN